MAQLTATAVDCFGFTTPVGPLFDNSSPPLPLQGCFVTCSLGAGAYTQGAGNGYLVSNIATQIAAVRRDGKTVSICDVGGVMPADEAGVPTMPYNCTVAVNAVSFRLTTGACLPATEHAAAAMGAMNRPVTLWVTYTLT